MKKRASSIPRHASVVKTCMILKAVVIFCVFLFASPLQAMDLQEAFTLALENDPQFVGTGYESDASREVLRQAWGAVLPELSAEGLYTETSQNILSSENQVFGSGKSSFPTTEYTLSLTQPLFNLASFVDIKRSREVVQAAELQLEAARQELAVRTSIAYFKVLAAQDRLQATVAEETSVSYHYDLVSERFKRGLSPRTEYYDAKARLAEVQANRLMVESDLDDAFQALAEIIGRPSGQLAPLRDEFPLVPADPDDAESWIEAAIKQNPSLAAIRHNVEASRQEIRRQRAGHYPHLNLEANHNWRENEGTLFGGGSEVETTTFMVRLNVPLYRGGIVQSRTREARLLMKASAQEEERLTRTVQRETRTAFFGVGSSIERVKALREAVEAQGLALEGKKEGHRSGLYTILAVLDGERDYSLARQNYAMARYDYILNTLILRKAVGTLGGDDIVAVNEWLEN